MSDIIRITFTDPDKPDRVTFVPECTPDQFQRRLAAGDFANLRLDRQGVRIEHGVSAGVKFLAKGYIANPTPAVTRAAQLAFEQSQQEKAAAEQKRHEPKAGDTLVIAGREYVIGEDGEPALVRGTEPQKPAKATTPRGAKRGKKQDAEATEPVTAPETDDGTDAADAPTGTDDATE